MDNSNSNGTNMVVASGSVGASATITGTNLATGGATVNSDGTVTGGAKVVGDQTMQLIAEEAARYVAMTDYAEAYAQQQMVQPQMVPEQQLTSPMQAMPQQQIPVNDTQKSGISPIYVILGTLAVAGIVFALATVIF